MKNEFKSKRLKEMFSDNEDDEGLFPKNLQEVIDKFDKLIIWKKVPGTIDTEFPEP